MLTASEFSNFNMGVDPYKGANALIRLSDVPLRDDSLPIKLSVMMSTFHRVSQLRRSLECLARQDWKEFEVIICDDGDDYDLSPIYREFEPYLRLKHIRRERAYFHVDPTGGFRTCFPLAEGDIWAIMQPELMLVPNACRYLYYGHYDPLPNATHYLISHKPTVNNPPIWVALKPYFFNKTMMDVLDSADWHTDMNSLQTLPGFWSEGCGLSNQSNTFWKPALEFPWWFIGSAKRDDPIWKDMPEYLGHASIDFYLLTYRNHLDYMDIVPVDPMAYHQDHHRASVGVEGEQVKIGVDVESIKAKRLASDE